MLALYLKNPAVTVRLRDISHMKKLIIFIATIFCLWLSASAQDSFYYYRGTKEPLTEDKTRIVAIAPESADINLLPSQGFTFVVNIQDSPNQIKVYELAPYADIKRTIEANPSDSISILPCYKSDKGVPLIPNGHIGVKLKSEDDYPTLQTVAEEMGCEIIEQNSFMPLWYTLRMKPAPCRNPVNIANAIYETGKFTFSSPGFSYNARE